MANIFSNHNGSQRRLVISHNLKNSSLSPKGLAKHRKILFHFYFTGILEYYHLLISSNSLCTKTRYRKCERLEMFQKQGIFFDTSVIRQFDIIQLPGRNPFLLLFQRHFYCANETDSQKVFSPSLSFVDRKLFALTSPSSVDMLWFQPSMLYILTRLPTVPFSQFKFQMLCLPQSSP